MKQIIKYGRDKNRVGDLFNADRRNRQAKVGLERVGLPLVPPVERRGKHEGQNKSCPIQARNQNKTTKLVLIGWDKNMAACQSASHDVMQWEEQLVTPCCGRLELQQQLQSSAVGE